VPGPSSAPVCPACAVEPEAELVLPQMRLPTSSPKPMPTTRVIINRRMNLLL